MTNIACKPGDRIRLDDPPSKCGHLLPVGTKGTVRSVYAYQTRVYVAVDWENRRSQDLVSPPDRFTVLAAR